MVAAADRVPGWLKAFALQVALAAATGSSGVALAQQGKAQGFYLDRLPVGKNVTIPKPATTFVPLTSRVQLTATDMPQSLSFTPVDVNGGTPRSIKLSIYDQSAARVKYVVLKPGTPFLYTYRELSSITVIPQAQGAGGALALQVESNKPLEIAH
jgi:hypothetical protein